MSGQRICHLPRLQQDIVEIWADSQCKIQKAKHQKGYNNWTEGYSHGAEGMCVTFLNYHLYTIRDPNMFVFFPIFIQMKDNRLGNNYIFQNLQSLSFQLKKGHLPSMSTT